MSETLNNAVTELIRSHRTIRAFEPDRPLSDELIGELVATAARASTSMGVQPYSVIAVTDQALKDQISELANNQAHIQQCSVLLVYCVDWSRIEWQLNQRETTLQVDPVFMLIDAVWDISLMAQNAALAAQSIGLGMCMIGAVLPCADKIGTLLGVGDKAVVMLGQCLGHAAEQPVQRPRLPLENILHFNRYTPTAESERQQAGLEEHDAMHAAQPPRPGNPTADRPWSEQKAMALGSGLYAAVFENLRTELERKLGIPAG